MTSSPCPLYSSLFTLPIFLTLYLSCRVFFSAPCSWLILSMISSLSPHPSVPSILPSLPSLYSSPCIYPAVSSSQPALPWPQVHILHDLEPHVPSLPLYSSLFTLPLFLTLYLSCCVFFSASVALASGSWLSMLSMSASHLTMLP